MKPFHREYRLVVLRGYGPLIVRFEYGQRCRTWTFGK